MSPAARVRAWPNAPGRPERAPEAAGRPGRSGAPLAGAATFALLAGATVFALLACSSLLGFDEVTFRTAGKDAGVRDAGGGQGGGSSGGAGEAGTAGTAGEAGAAGEAGSAGAAPCPTDCTGRQCGFDQACNLSCGDCPGGQTCVATEHGNPFWQCVPTCDCSNCGTCDMQNFKDTAAWVLYCGSLQTSPATVACTKPCPPGQGCIPYGTPLCWPGEGCMSM
jgi:hypothetical protein